MGKVMITFYDNGIIKFDIFDAGRKVQVIQSDGSGSEGSGVKGWSKIDARYDLDGALTERVTAYDDGVLKSEYFEAGQRTVQLDGTAERLRDGS